MKGWREVGKGGEGYPRLQSGGGSRWPGREGSGHREGNTGGGGERKEECRRVRERRGEEVNIHRGPGRGEGNEEGHGCFLFFFPFEAFPRKEEKRGRGVMRQGRTRTREWGIDRRECEREEKKCDCWRGFCCCREKGRPIGIVLRNHRRYR